MQSWLYDINARISALNDVLEAGEYEDISPDVKAALMGIYESDVPAAVEDGIGYIKAQEAQIAAIDTEIKRLQAIKKARENRLARVKAGYTEFLLAVEKKKIETPRGSMTVAAPTFTTVIDSIDELPDAYKRATVKIEADKASIKQAIQGGHNVKGAHLEERQSIRIK